MPLDVVREPDELRARCDAIRGRGGRVGFVPTMGALHEGHLRLVDAARQRSDFVAVSVFVNPTQFGPGEDFERYPRDLDGDVAKLAARGVDLVFAPAAAAMYPEGACTTVSVSGITEGLCGAHRPGHFAGVATIVTKLFSVVGPCTAVFGRKDYQQLKVVERLVEDLRMPVEIFGAPIVREADGLAMSSRNAYLSAAERERGLSLSRGLAAAHGVFGRGERSARAVREAVAAIVGGSADSVDYVAVADPDTLRDAGDSRLGERALVAVAARFGRTRLIDNTVLGEDASPVPR